MNPPNRSPIKDKPLRYPGQGLDEQRRKLVEDKLESWLFLGAVAVAVAMLEWIRYVRPFPAQPWAVTVVALFVCAFAAWRVFRFRPVLRQLRQGAEGEKAVGQFLDRLRTDGYHVFHDVQGDGFNVDHVLIGPGGVLSIETKTWSKPVSGDARVHYDGERLRVAGREPDRDPLAQAQSQATWLRRLLQESTGKALPVQPVIVFPGWFVEAAPGSHRQVWVLEPKGLPAFLARQPKQLDESDVKLASYHLSRYIRAGERDAAV